MTTEADIRALEDRRYKAMQNVDIRALEGLLSDGLIYTHSSARQDTKASYVESIRSGKVVYHTIKREEEKISVSGNAAIVTGKFVVEATAGGQRRNMVNRYLNVWLNEGGVWRMAAWQSTPVPAA